MSELSQRITDYSTNLGEAKQGSPDVDTSNIPKALSLYLKDKSYRNAVKDSFVDWYMIKGAKLVGDRTDKDYTADEMEIFLAAVDKELKHKL